MNDTNALTVQVILPLNFCIFALLIAKDGGTGPTKSWQPGNGPGATSNPKGKDEQMWVLVDLPCASKHP